MSETRTNLAKRLIDRIFAERYQPGTLEVSFKRDDLISAAEALGAPRPKNLGDIVYSLRYRVALPESIRSKALQGREWAIFPGGKAVYTMRTVPLNLIEPRQGLRTTLIPDSTPGVISMYSQSDEQALLAGVRYNRLLDVFTGLACYSLQSHLRTSVAITNAIDGTPSSSQVETDELYVGLDKNGAHHIPPRASKGWIGRAQRDPDLAGLPSRRAEVPQPDRPTSRGTVHGQGRDRPLRVRRNQQRDHHHPRAPLQTRRTRRTHAPQNSPRTATPRNAHPIRASAIVWG